MSDIIKGETLAKGQVVLIPVEVPMASGRVLAGFVFIASLGILGAAVAYNAGREDGQNEERRIFERELQARMKAVEEKADARVEEIRRERGSPRQHEART